MEEAFDLGLLGWESLLEEATGEVHEREQQKNGRSKEGKNSPRNPRRREDNIERENGS